MIPVALRNRQRRPQRNLELQLLSVALSALRQRAQQLERLVQVTDGLGVGEVLRRAFPGPLVVADRLRRAPRLLAVVGDLLGRAGDALGEARFEGVGDASVEVHALAVEQRLVGRVLHQCVLEGVGRLRR